MEAQMNQLYPGAMFLGLGMAISFLVNVATVVVGLCIWDRWFRRR